MLVSDKRLSSKLVAHMFWWGEVENSTNELGGKWKEFAFRSDSDREVLMEKIEANRRISNYSHVCYEDCAERGNGSSPNHIMLT